jgi:hypothetical protein
LPFKFNLQRYIAVYQTLRAALAAPLESVVLLDRFLFLSQGADAQEEGGTTTSISDGGNTKSAGGHSVSLRAIFDPTASPRNMALIARRT